MAQPKRFTKSEFIEQLNKIIDEYIAFSAALTSSQDAEKKDIRVKYLANTFNVNVATFRRWCKEYTGYAPKNYLDRYRIEKAKHLLRQGIKPSTVSKVLAFSEHKTFSTVFKRYENIVPTQLS
ncbi:MAG: helix-turn-helix transcriptional regulator [Colwellia sp.]|nr:helix-turn-helix transcriptional regulator [Colwellia sp.]